MSESDEHRSLVRSVENTMRAVFPGAAVFVDIRSEAGSEIPPTIDGFRPDVFVRGRQWSAIAEAKTDRDLDNRHTHRQLTSFIEYLDRTRGGLLVLSVAGWRADRAKTMLRFIRQETTPIRTRVAVFDQLDLWRLRSNGITWEIQSFNE